MATNLASKRNSLILSHTSKSSAAPTASFAKPLSTDHSVRVVVIRVEMGDPFSPEDLIKEFPKQFDPFSIDILINNAAIGPQARIMDINIDDYHRTYTVNVHAPLLLMKAALP